MLILQGYYLGYPIYGPWRDSVGLIFMPSVGARIDQGRRTPANLGGNHFTDRGELAWILSR